MQLYQMKAKPPDTLIPTKNSKELTTRPTTLPYHQRHPTIHVIETKRVTKQKAHPPTSEFILFVKHLDVFEGIHVIFLNLI